MALQGRPRRTMAGRGRAARVTTVLLARSRIDAGRGSTSSPGMATGTPPHRQSKPQPHAARSPGDTRADNSRDRTSNDGGGHRSRAKSGRGPRTGIAPPPTPARQRAPRQASEARRHPQTQRNLRRSRKWGLVLQDRGSDVKNFTTNFYVDFCKLLCFFFLLLLLLL